MHISIYEFVFGANNPPTMAYCSTHLSTHSLMAREEITAKITSNTRTSKIGGQLPPELQQFQQNERNQKELN